MKIISYNVNGLRAAQQKGFAHWLEQQQADIVCLQEIKTRPDQLDVTPFEALGYHLYWFPAQKPGYSGVAIFSRPKPLHVAWGCGIDKYDQEGRVLRADYPGLSVMSVYMPSGSSGEERQAFKMQWLEDFGHYIAGLRQELPNLIISGDYNICHKAIDIHDPIRNKNSSGFLPEEREWFESFVCSGFIDTFRYFNQDPHHYSWWSYRAGARSKNKGWRIDYNLASLPLQDRLKSATILPDALHSDHCPVVVELL
ncbi:exodeoxyribonuclease III [Cesiribacter andamanensis]|uniref:Exodeoxyribonuclease n=1 Tax=Cesiribacter andamanensis AMV16 TaxID=1279009 RepID=M7N758_9BACT|nr:exodeoxyribonuclease III [Cesiribacter andamanensis]EMR03107.1 Exodeoxyribonuclease [Cesiribacter andamanensis AMV16]